MEMPRAALAIRFTSPDKTFPAPHSMNTEIPFPAMKAMLSRQRTMPVTWAIRRLRISSGLGDRRRKHIRNQGHARRLDER